EDAVQSAFRGGHAGGRPPHHPRASRPARAPGDAWESLGGGGPPTAREIEGRPQGMAGHLLAPREAPRPAWRGHGPEAPDAVGPYAHVRGLGSRDRLDHD